MYSSNGTAWHGLHTDGGHAAVDPGADFSHDELLNAFVTQMVCQALRAAGVMVEQIWLCSWMN